MAKPILLARVHKNATLDIQEKCAIQLSNNTGGEYHILVVNSLKYNNITIEVFNADKVDPISIEELTKKLKIITKQ